MSHRTRNRKGEGSSRGTNGKTTHCMLVNRHVPIKEAVKRRDLSVAHCMFCGGDKGSRCKQ